MDVGVVAVPTDTIDITEDIRHLQDDGSVIDTEDEGEEDHEIGITTIDEGHLLIQDIIGADTGIDCHRDDGRDEAEEVQVPAILLRRIKEIGRMVTVIVPRVVVLIPSLQTARMCRVVERLSTALHEAKVAAGVLAAEVEIVDAETVDVAKIAMMKVRMTKEVVPSTVISPSTWNKQNSPS